MEINGSAKYFLLQDGQHEDGLIVNRKLVVSEDQWGLRTIQDFTLYTGHCTLPSLYTTTVLPAISQPTWIMHRPSRCPYLDIDSAIPHTSHLASLGTCSAPWDMWGGRVWWEKRSVTCRRLVVSSQCTAASTSLSPVTLRRSRGSHSDSDSTRDWLQWGTETELTTSK